MKISVLISTALLGLALCVGCGPRQFQRSGSSSTSTTTDSGGGFENVDGEEEPDAGHVIVSDDSDEAWDGVDDEVGEDW